MIWKGQPRSDRNQYDFFHYSTECTGAENSLGILATALHLPYPCGTTVRTSEYGGSILARSPNVWHGFQ